VTEGVVSRIQFDYYSHSASRMLMVQVDAAMNSGNSGGPVVSDGKVVGISMQALNPDYSRSLSERRPRMW
jgi:S1-C subfamily serine protease